MSFFLKTTTTTKHIARIAQLSCTLVCLEPTALFWDNIRGFKPEYRATCLHIADLKTASFSFSGSLRIHTFVSFLQHQSFSATYLISATSPPSQLKFHGFKRFCKLVNK